MRFLSSEAELHKVQSLLPLSSFCGTLKKLLIPDIKSEFISVSCNTMKYRTATMFGFHGCEILECVFLNYNILNVENVGLCV